jgi:hypothetical protein
MKIYFYYTLLIYILSLILSCSESKDRKSENSDNNITNKKDSIIYTLDDTLIAHASVLNDKAYGILKSKLLKSIRDRGVSGSVKNCSYKENAAFSKLCKDHNIMINRYELKNTLNSNLLKGVFHDFNKNKTRLSKVLHTDSSSSVYIGLKLDQSICLSCHGTPHQDILSETWNALLKTDSTYNQHSYMPNELMGLWETVFHKKKKE